MPHTPSFVEHFPCAGLRIGDLFLYASGKKYWRALVKRERSRKMVSSQTLSKPGGVDG
jgi:hypothetical protein